MNNIAFGQYYPIDSIIHKLDPRLKIGGLFLLLISVFIDAGFLGYTFLFIYLMSLYKASHLPLSRLLKALKTIIFMMLLLSLFNILFIKSGSIVLSIGPLDVYSYALFQSLYIIIRLILIIIATTLLTSTTKPLDMTLGLEYLMRPLKKVGFPAHEIAMMISIALRFIPTLIEEAQRIMKAQVSRGVDFEEGKLNEKIKAIISLIVPLFISSFQKADDLANAMESRNYHPSAMRTRYHNLKWSIQDTIGFISLLSLNVILIYWSLMI